MGWDPKKIEMGCPKERGKAFRNNAFWMWSPLFFISIISLLLLDDDFDDFDDTTDKHIDDTD